MARSRNRSRRPSRRRMRKKVSVLTRDKIDYVDYKDVNLLRRFISDRAKIRTRKITGNNEQQQRAVALAIKNAREMALLPYENRVTSQRRLLDSDRFGMGAPEGADGGDMAAREPAVGESAADPATGSVADPAATPAPTAAASDAGEVSAASDAGVASAAPDAAAAAGDTPLGAAPAASNEGSSSNTAPADAAPAASDVAASGAADPDAVPDNQEVQP